MVNNYHMMIKSVRGLKEKVQTDTDHLLGELEDLKFRLACRNGENAAKDHRIRELEGQVEDRKQLKEAMTHFRGTVQPELEKRIAKLEGGLREIQLAGGAYGADTVQAICCRLLKGGDDAKS